VTDRARDLFKLQTLYGFGKSSSFDKNNWEVLDLDCVGDVAMGVGLQYFGRGYRALAPNQRANFWLKLFWKIGYDPSL